MFTNRGMDEEDVIYTHTMEYYSSIKRNKIMPFTAAWMDLEIVIQSEVSQKEMCHIIPLICGT